MKKRTFLLLVIAMLAAAGLGMLVVEHQGYVLISWKNIRFEATLWVFLACLAVLLVGLYLVRLLLGAALHSIGWVNPWSASNKRKRLATASEAGMLEFARGNWEPALRHLTYASKTSEQPMPYLLAAVRAAEKLQQSSTADNLLAKARGTLPEQDLAISLCQAELYQQRGQLQEAQATLLAAYQQHADNGEVLVRLYQLYEDNHDWGGIIGVLPALRKAKQHSEAELNHIEYRAWQGRLLQVADLPALQTVWDTMPSSLHRQSSLVLAYCSQLLRFGQDQTAESLLQHQLNQDFDVQLFQAYAQIPHHDPSRALKHAETWLSQAPDDAQAMYAMGKLCVQAKLWGRAQDYLRASLERQPNPQVYAELARLLNQLGDYKASDELLTSSIKLLNQHNNAAV